jgi:hypothetical protein
MKLASTLLALFLLSAPTLAQHTVWLTTSVNATGTADSVPSDFTELVLQSNGLDLWGSRDSATFVHRKASGDAFLTTRLVSFTNGQWNAKAGVFVRETLAAGSKQVSISLKPNGGVEVLARLETDGAMRFVRGYQSDLAKQPYLSIERNEAFVTVALWDSARNLLFMEDIRIELPTDFYIGLVATSGASYRTATAVFDNLTVVQR